MTLDIATIFDRCYNRQVLMITDGEGLDTLSNEEIAQQIRENVLAAIVELTEILNEFQWKPWKNNVGEHNGELYDSYVEVADVLLFLMNTAAWCSTLLGQRDTGKLLEEAIADKMDIVNKRHGVEV